jgi:hypothetical protein
LTRVHPSGWGFCWYGGGGGVDQSGTVRRGSGAWARLGLPILGPDMGRSDVTAVPGRVRASHICFRYEPDMDCRSVWAFELDLSGTVGCGFCVRTVMGQPARMFGAGMSPIVHALTIYFMLQYSYMRWTCMSRPTNHT